MGWRVALTDTARADLEQITTFRAQRSQRAANRTGAAIVDVIFSLADFPFQGAQVRHMPGFRKISVGGVLVYYRLHEAVGIIEVARVWDGRRR
jgi:plasmid stabilization system protein ParE